MKDIYEFDFVLKIIASFQDYDNLYLVTNFFEGDVLYNYKDEDISEDQIKFISACIIQSLSYLRKKKIINRDIRMKNIIMDKKRYLNLIDFSFAIKYSEKNNLKNIITGNKNETAPEIMNHSIYDYNSDYYRIGIIIYYLIFKEYVNVIKKERKINELIIDSNNIKNYSIYCIDFINKLIITDYKERIGFKDINELKNHFWFKGFDWENFERKKMESPLKFMKKKFNKSKCKILSIEKDRIRKHKIFEKKNFYKRLIKRYDYVNDIVINNIINSIKNHY